MLHSYAPFYIVHVLSLFILVGTTLASFVAPVPENRKKMLMWSGIGSLGVFLSGFGLLGVQHYGYPGWAIVKLVCWLVLSGFAGMAFRQPDKIRPLLLSALGLVVVALVMVYFKPF
ncbi:MAG: hypothetical protein U0136_18625 [Bdellovibrionota bacterium]